MRTHDEIEAELHRLGWTVDSGPTKTPSGWKATIKSGTASKMTTGATAIGVLEDLLRSVQPRRRS